MIHRASFVSADQPLYFSSNVVDQYENAPSAMCLASAFCIPVSCIVLRNQRTRITRVRMFLYFNLMALCHSQVTLMLSTDINITETTYSCQFQYEFGNQ